MEKQYKIKNGLKKAGRKVRLGGENWLGMEYYAVIEHNHRKTKSNFDDRHTEIGAADKDFYTYIGPFDHDITAVPKVLLYAGNSEIYSFKKAEAVRFNDEIIYYFGILKKYRRADYDRYTENSAELY